MARNVPTPHVSQALLDFLKASFPDRIPDKTLSDASAYAVLVGQQEVIRKLQRLFDAQVSKDFA